MISVDVISYDLYSNVTQNVALKIGPVMQTKYFRLPVVCFNQLNRGIWHSSISISTKVQLYRVYIQPILRYGSEHGPWPELSKTGSPPSPLTTSASDVSYWFPTQLMLPMLMYTTPSRLPTTAVAAHPNKTAPFLWACGTDERLPRHFQSPTYVDPWTAQGLETPPTSHLASDPKCRPPSAQPRTQLSMATCPGQRTMEATRGNGYAPAWVSLVMMMMSRLSP